MQIYTILKWNPKLSTEVSILKLCMQLYLNKMQNIKF
jgi:hypothetical protein